MILFVFLLTRPARLSAHPRITHIKPSDRDNRSIWNTEKLHTHTQTHELCVAPYSANNSSWKRVSMRWMRKNWSWLLVWCAGVFSAAAAAHFLPSLCQFLVSIFPYIFGHNIPFFHIDRGIYSPWCCCTVNKIRVFRLPCTACTVFLW